MNQVLARTKLPRRIRLPLRIRLLQHEAPSDFPPAAVYTAEDLTEHQRGGESSESRLWGYLQTYVTRRPLRLLYLDGMSAAKTKGALDFQDRVILQGRFNLTSDDQRAAELCRAAREERRIDGFMRMEMGFEVILCSVADVDLHHAGSMLAKTKDAFACYKEPAQRFHGIGHMVTADYDQFVTTHGRADKDVRPELDALMKSESDGQINWQGVTDMIVERYSTPP